MIVVQKKQNQLTDNPPQKIASTISYKHQPTGYQLYSEHVIFWLKLKVSQISLYMILVQVKLVLVDYFWGLI